MITNKDILECVDKIRYFDDVEIDFEVSLAISKFQRELNLLALDINKIRDKTVQSFAERDKDGKIVQIDMENGAPGIKLKRDKIAECNDKLEELMGLNNPNAPRIPSKYFKGMKIPHGVTSSLMPFLDMKEEMKNGS